MHTQSAITRTNANASVPRGLLLVKTIPRRGDEFFRSMACCTLGRHGRINDVRTSPPAAGNPSHRMPVAFFLSDDGLYCVGGPWRHDWPPW